jgi:hypothetical protein
VLPGHTAGLSELTGLSWHGAAVSKPGAPMRGDAGLGYGSTMPSCPAPGMPAPSFVRRLSHWVVRVLPRFLLAVLAAFFVWRLAGSVIAYRADLHATAQWREGYRSDEGTRIDNALAAPGDPRPTPARFWIESVRRHVPEGAHLYFLQEIDGPGGHKRISTFYQVANLLYPRLVQPIDDPQVPATTASRRPSQPAYVLDLRAGGDPAPGWTEVENAPGARLWRIDSGAK